jgi:hypothetical protein
MNPTTVALLHAGRIWVLAGAPAAFLLLFIAACVYDLGPGMTQFILVAMLLMLVPIAWMSIVEPLWYLVTGRESERGLDSLALYVGCHVGYVGGGIWYCWLVGAL